MAQTSSAISQDTMQPAHPSTASPAQVKQQQTAVWHKSSQCPSRLQAECSAHLKPKPSPSTSIQATSSTAHHLPPTSRQCLKAMTRQSSSTATHWSSQHLTSGKQTTTSLLKAVSSNQNSHTWDMTARTSTQNLKSAQKRVVSKQFTCPSTCQQ